MPSNEMYSIAADVSLGRICNYKIFQATSMKWHSHTALILILYELI